jgi:hypothetical protein
LRACVCVCRFKVIYIFVVSFLSISNEYIFSEKELVTCVLSPGRCPSWAEELVHESSHGVARNTQLVRDRFVGSQRALDELWGEVKSYSKVTPSKRGRCCKKKGAPNVIGLQYERRCGGLEEFEGSETIPEEQNSSIMAMLWGSDIFNRPAPVKAAEDDDEDWEDEVEAEPEQPKRNRTKALKQTLIPEVVKRMNESVASTSTPSEIVNFPSGGSEVALSSSSVSSASSKQASDIDGSCVTTCKETSKAAHGLLSSLRTSQVRTHNYKSVREDFARVFDQLETNLAEDFQNALLAEVSDSVDTLELLRETNELHGLIQTAGDVLALLDDDELEDFDSDYFASIMKFAEKQNLKFDTICLHQLRFEIALDRQFQRNSMHHIMHRLAKQTTLEGYTWTFFPESIRDVLQTKWLTKIFMSIILSKVGEELALHLIEDIDQQVLQNEKVQRDLATFKSLLQPRLVGCPEKLEALLADASAEAFQFQLHGGITGKSIVKNVESVRFQMLREVKHNERLSSHEIPNLTTEDLDGMELPQKEAVRKIEKGA